MFRFPSEKSKPMTGGVWGGEMDLRNRDVKDQVSNDTDDGGSLRGSSGGDNDGVTIALRV